MHELSIAQSLLAAVQRQLPSGARHPVKSVRVRLGGLSGVTADALSFSFSLASRGTPAERAALEIEAVPIVFRCRKCDWEDSAASFVRECPACRGVLDLVSGDELDLVSIEVGDPVSER